MKKSQHGLRDFWALARELLHYRTRVVLALLFALLGAGGLSAGLLAAKPVLDAIITPDAKKLRTLPDLVTDLNAQIGGIIPPSWIAELPSGRFTAVVWVVVGLCVIALLAATFNFLHAYLSMTVVARTIADIRERLFEHVLHLPMRAFMARGPSNQLTRVLNDCGDLGGGFNNLLNKTVENLFKSVACVATAFVIDWKLSAIAIPTALVLWAVIRRTGHVIRKGARKGLVARGGVLQAASETIENLRVVKTSTAEGRESDRFRRANRQVVRQEMKVRTAKAISGPLVEMITLFALGLLTLIATKAIIDRNLDPQRFIMTLGALGLAANSLRPLTGVLNDLQAAAAAAERIRELHAEPVEAGYAPGRPDLPRHAQSIRFEHVTYTYPGGETPAVRDVDLTIPHGETVAFVGPNGSGKTTLLSLVPALLDPDGPAHGRPRGRVLIDGADVALASLGSVRGQIGVVTQETMLFKGSVHSNLAFGAAGASDEAIKAAARKARAEEFILARPGGYQSEIGERGSGLSGGQRQRIAIARAILRDPAILILDEATSMIDADSEAKIAAALEEFGRGRTCLIIAHRLSTVVHADRIVVMDHGRVVDVGRHAELLARCAVYRLIAEHQLVKAGAPEAVGAASK